MSRESIHTASDGNPWPNIRQNLGNSIDEVKEELEETEESRALKGNLQNQLTWVYRSPQRLSHKKETIHVSDVRPRHIYNSYDLGRSSYRTPNRKSMGCNWVCCLPLDPFRLLGCLAWPQ